MQRSIQRYGWNRDLPDYRDIFYKDVHSPKALGIVVDPTNLPVHNAVIVNNSTIVSSGLASDGLPKVIDLRHDPRMPPVYDQLQLGSCTANASEAMFAFVFGGGPYSRLQLYYNSRLIEGTVAYDSGAYLRDVISVLVNVGTGLEQDWPYVESKFKDAPPPVEVSEEASHKAPVYSRLQNREDFRHCLAQGFPFVVGISVYSSFESDQVAQTGIVPMPNQNDSMVGGHAICVVGYDDDFQGSGHGYYICRNSWGNDWGAAGYMYIPCEYIENPNLASDMWTVRKG